MHIKVSAPDKTRNLFLLPLACLSLFLLYSCDSQKNSMKGVPAQGGEGPSAKTSPGGPPAAGLQPPGSDARESAAKGAQGISENLPAITKLQLKPEVVNNVDALRVYAEGSGGDGEVTFKYEWTKNGEPAGDGSTLAGFKRSDRVSVRVTPGDGKTEGPSRTLTTEIGNLPPKIIEHRDLISTGKVFSYQVRALDPDGDALSFSLKSAPQGMTIDPEAGLIKWDVPAGFGGRAAVTVSVTDGHGGEVFQSFTVDVKTERRKP